MGDYLFYLLSFLAGGFSGYFIAYLKEKGRNKALIEDIAFLEEEKQKVQGKHAAELERIKAQHSLEFELRKHQYQDKRNQFAKFFGLLDEFNRKNNTAFSERFDPIINALFAEYTQDDKVSMDRAVSNFNKKIQALFNDISEENLRLISETNSIRLISSKKIDDLLDKLESGTAVIFEQSVAIMKVMATPEFWADKTIIEEHQRHALETVESVRSIRNDLRMQMKEELGEI